MGFPYDSASWDAVDGAMYMGAGGSAPFLWTLVAVGVCVWALWAGNRKEHSLYNA